MCISKCRVGSIVVYWIPRVLVFPPNLFRQQVLDHKWILTTACATPQRYETFSSKWCFRFIKRSQRLNAYTHLFLYIHGGVCSSLRAGAEAVETSLMCTAWRSNSCFNEVGVSGSPCLIPLLAFSEIVVSWGSLDLGQIYIHCHQCKKRVLLRRSAAWKDPERDASSTETLWCNTISFFFSIFDVSPSRVWE